MHSITLAALLLTLSTASFSYAAAVFPTYINETAAIRSHHQLWARQDLDIPIVCPLNVRGQSPLADIFNHFGFISYGDARLDDDYPFPLAVKGELSTSRTDNININHPGTCAVDDTSDVYSYGLDNPGTNSLGATSVYGNVLLGDPSSTRVVPVGENCDLYSTDRSVVDYEKVRTGLRAATRYLASLAPDLTIDSTGLVNSIAEPVNPHFRVFTVNTCYPPASDSRTCSSWSLSQLSTADMFGRDRDSIWNGPTNSEVLEEAETIVINVPVPQSRTLFIFYTDPSLGFKNCKTIFNFYAVNESGEFVESDTPFRLAAYNDKSIFEGFILAPDADSSSYYMKLAGKLFTNIFYDAQGMDDFSCEAKAYTACFPVQDYTETSSSSTDESSTSTDESSTSTDESSTSTDESSTSTDESSTSTDESSTSTDESSTSTDESSTSTDESSTSTDESSTSTDESSTSTDESSTSTDESSTSTDESSTSETSDCTSGTTTETVTTETTTTEASTTTTDYTTTTTTEDTTVASTTVTVTQSATSTVFTTTTSTFTTTYTSDHSTITAVVTTTAPVFVPVENSWDDERGGRRHGGREDRKHGDWEGQRHGDWEDQRYDDWENDEY
ncbi:hypothetical protein BJV82DRAFT_708071 [Fennellomyces sp. T-0311]|nr:hypothetical protein BJV82DRAFT_708071 [Fennellomyces sp. T-0311]